jgi:hypothetical protein
MGEGWKSGQAARPDGAPMSANSTRMFTMTEVAFREGLRLRVTVRSVSYLHRNLAGSFAWDANCPT